MLAPQKIDEMVRIKKRLTATAINAKLYFIERMPEAEQKEALDKLSKEMEDCVYDLNEPIKCIPFQREGYRVPIICTSLLGKWCREYSKKPEFALFLIARGADLNHVNKPGFSVLEMCLNNAEDSLDDRALILYCNAGLDINLACRTERLMQEKYIEAEQLPESLSPLECYTTFPYLYEKNRDNAPHLVIQRNEIITAFLKAGAVVTPRAFANFFDSTIPERFSAQVKEMNKSYLQREDEFLHFDIHPEILNRVRNQLLQSGTPASIKALEREVVRLFSLIKGGYEIKNKVFRLIFYPIVIVRILKQHDNVMRLASECQNLSEVGIPDSVVQLILQYTFPKPNDSKGSKSDFFAESYLESSWNAMIKSSQLAARYGKLQQFSLMTGSIDDRRDLHLTCGYDPDLEDFGKDPSECVWLFSGSYLKDSEKEKRILEKLDSEKPNSEKRGFEKSVSEKCDLEKMADQYPRT